MNADYITGFFYEAIKMSRSCSRRRCCWPGCVVGLLVSIFQSATSINEMTLTFIPKMLAVAAALIFFFPWMMQTLVGFTEQMFMNMNQYIR